MHSLNVSAFFSISFIPAVGQWNSIHFFKFQMNENFLGNVQITLSYSFVPGIVTLKELRKPAYCM